MTGSSRAYLPAAGFNWALPFYDPLVNLMGCTPARKALLDQAALRPGFRVLDIGCGTGTLAVLIKQLNPEVDVVGIDPDPKALARGRRKAARAALAIQFDCGFADQVPYPDASFDRVFSSFMFHHLTAAEKSSTLRDVHRVLKPGGELHLLDFEGPADYANNFFARLIHSHPRLRDNSESSLLPRMREAGFPNPAKVGRRRLLVGRIAYFRAAA